MLILSVQDVRPCGVQRGDREPSIGFEYREQCFDFMTLEWMDYTTAIEHCRTYLDEGSGSDDLYCLLKGPQGYRLCRHDQDLKKVSIQIVLKVLCEAMAAEPGLVDSRRWRLRVFDQCFVGRDAVTWIQQHYSIPRPEALKIGKACLKLGLFSHVLGEQDFADEQYYYRFHWHGDPENRIVPDLNSFKSDLEQLWRGPSLEADAGPAENGDLAPHTAR